MKVIYNNTIPLVTASHENENYPAENVLNDSPKKVWKSQNITPQVFTVYCAPGSQAIAFFNVSGVSNISATSLEAGDFEWGSPTSWGSPTTWGEIENPNISFSADFDDETTEFWYNFPVTLVNSVKLELTITNNDFAIASIGLISSGPIFSCQDPSPDWSYDFVDYSVITELSNGAFDTRDRDVVRTFSGSTYMNFDPQWFQFSRLIRNIIKSNPKAWFFASDNDNQEYIMYARFSSLPSASMTSGKNVGAAVGINLLEVV